MNIKFIDNLTFDIYLKNEFISNIDFNKKEDLENYLKKLFKILKDKYSILIEGFYDITVYKDKYYGIIIHLEKEELEYYEYFKNQVDMRLVVIDTEFLYLVDDIPKSNKYKVIVKNNEIYLKIVEKLNKLEMMELLENIKTICYE